jgi:hypothetical protein
MRNDSFGKTTLDLEETSGLSAAFSLYMEKE